MSKAKDQKTIVDVRIVDISHLPPHYFLHEAVLATLRDVVRSDVVVKGNPVPPGATPIFGHRYSIIAKNSALRSLRFESRSALKRNWAAIIICWCMIIIFLVYLLLDGAN